MPKKDIHPTWYPDAVVKLNGEEVMRVGATTPEISVEIWSGTHPFYTGQQRLVDTEGQVDRFMRRLQKRQEHQAAIEGDMVEPQDPSEITLDAIPSLTDRAKAALQGEGLNTLADLVARLDADGDDGLLSILSVGQQAVISIKKHLRAQDLIE
jgi:large subunit ribosomal protein L31